ncbi:hypothetical protein ACFWA4_21730 [Streptomyces sp. NPDC060011]|uniref:hypothetical protein n=1 Tax=unclassified Streptomyces TaxID=2593676 RepID=UPI00365C2438
MVVGHRWRWVGNTRGGTWELAERLQELCFSLLHWGTAHFGEPAGDEDGHQGPVSRKQI